MKTSNPLPAPLRVLLVEDSKLLSERLSDAIKQVHGVELIGAIDTEDSAISAVHDDPVDVVVLDLHLKNGSGFGLLRSIAAQAHKPTVIVLTNYGLPEYKKAAMDLGATYFLDKARDSGRLSDVLSEISRAKPVS